MNVAEVIARLEKFRRDLDAHAKLWGQSLDHTIPEFPIRNIEDLRSQSNSLARQLGTLRPYFEKLGLPSIMGNAYIGQWDAFDSAVSNDVAPRKGPRGDGCLVVRDGDSGDLVLAREHQGERIANRLHRSNLRHFAREWAFLLSMLCRQTSIQQNRTRYI